jgi:hypothetical protein
MSLLGAEDDDTVFTAAVIFRIIAEINCAKNLKSTRSSDCEICQRIHKILVRIRIHGSKPLTNDPYSDPDPVIFVSDLQDVNKKFLSFFLLINF